MAWIWKRSWAATWCLYVRLFRLQVAVFVSSVEAGAGLHGVEHVMTHDQGLGELGMKSFQQQVINELQGQLIGLAADVMQQVEEEDEEEDDDKKKKPRTS